MLCVQVTDQLVMLACIVADLRHQPLRAGSHFHVHLVQLRQILTFVQLERVNRCAGAETSS